MPSFVFMKNCARNRGRKPLIAPAVAHTSCISSSDAYSGDALFRNPKIVPYIAIGFIGGLDAEMFKCEGVQSPSGQSIPHPPKLSNSINQPDYFAGENFLLRIANRLDS